MLKLNSATFYKFILFACLLLTYTQEIRAEAWNSSGVYVATGKTNISANEIVYSQTTAVKDYKLSHLTWETQNAPVTILGFRQRITDFIILNLEGRRLNKQSKSVMDDYDWLYTSTSDWSDWSHHDDTLLTQADSYNASLAFTLIGNTKGYFALIGGYKKETIQWKSYGGTYVYSSSSFRDSSGSFTTGSAAIDYKQEYTTPYYGLKLGALLGNWLYTLQAITSNNVQLEATDIHHSRNLVFKDSFEPGKMSDYKLGIGYLFGDNVSINFIYGLQTYEEARGNTVQSSTVTGNVTGTCVNCAGSGNTSSTTSIGISLYF